MSEKVITIVETKVPIPERRSIAKFTAMCNEAVQMCNDERLDIDEVSFGKEGQNGVFRLDMESEKTYKQDSHMDVVAYIQEQILEYPHSAATFEYRTNIVGGADDDDQEEA